MINTADGTTMCHIEIRIITRLYGRCLCEDSQHLVHPDANISAAHIDIKI